MSEKGFAELDRMTASLRALPDALERGVVDAARSLDEHVRKQIAAGTDSAGVAWERRKDGGKPLETAANALTVAPVGDSIVFRLGGHIARHHRGRVRGGVARPIIPIDKLPADYADRIRAALNRRLSEALGGGNG